MVRRKFNVDKKDRFCSLCSEQDKMGTEYHIISECTNVQLVLYRKKLLRVISSVSPQIVLLNLEQTFLYLISGIENQITYYFSIFLDKIDKLLVNKMNS